MTDFSLAAESSLSNELFGAIGYPWRKRFDMDRLLTEDGDPRSVQSELIGLSEDNDDLAGETDDLIEDLVELFLDNRSQQERGETEHALADLVEPYLTGADEEDVSTICRTMEAEPNFDEELESFLRKVLEFSVEWVEGELSRQPDSNLGNPIALSNMRMAIRAKGKGCIKVFGKKYCVKVTSPWVRLEGKRAEIHLEADGPKLRARAKAHDIDIVIKIRILKWTWKIKIGVTSIVNRALSSQRPVLIDLRAIQVKVPGLDLVYKPSSLTVPSSNSTTTVEVDGTFT